MPTEQSPEAAVAATRIVMEDAKKSASRATEEYARAKLETSKATLELLPGLQVKETAARAAMEEAEKKRDKADNEHAVAGAALEEAQAERARKSSSTALRVTVGLTAAAMAGVFTSQIFLLVKPSSDTAPQGLAVLICLLGLAFACLGFGLFLVGATGAFKGSTTNSKSSISVETAAPGLVVMVCATFVIYLATDLIKAPSVEPAHAQAGSGSGSQSAGSGSGSSAGSGAGSSAGSNARSTAGTSLEANGGGTGAGSGSQGLR